jgi:hypothetical protein
LSLIGGVNVTLMIDVSADQCFKYILDLLDCSEKNLDSIWLLILLFKKLLWRNEVL